MKKKYLFLLLCILTLTGCSTEEYPSAYDPTPAPLLDDLPMMQTDGTAIFSDGTYASINYSHVEDGYIVAKRLDQEETKIKIIIEKDDKKYNYDLRAQEETALPLQMGDGEYEIRILKQLEHETYAKLSTQRIQVSMPDPLAPFRYPNQIVQFDSDSLAVQKSFELVKEDTTDLERILSLYEYVVTNITYDDAKAEAVQNAFVLPIIDETYQTNKGICFDYAALLTAMLRAQHIPARLVTGYTDIEYHAWVEVYLKGEGWINPKVYFAKESWSRMDPTFAASDKDYEGKYEEVYVY